MKTVFVTVTLISLIAVVIVAILNPIALFEPGLKPTPTTMPTPTSEVSMQLPEPRFTSNVSLEETLLHRRSIRAYTDKALTLEEVSQLLWAAQGITAEWGGRTAPSAGALYPLEVYVAVGNVDKLSPGVYKYNSQKHELMKLGDTDVREKLAEASLGQTSVREGAIDIVITAVYERTTRKYGDRGVRYVHIEAGHAAQNICLQATALALGVVIIGAFYDEEVKDIMGTSANEIPLYVIPIGRKF